MMKLTRGRLVGAVIVVAALGAAWFLLQGRTKPAATMRAGANRPVPVVTTPVQREDVPIYLDGIGTVQAFNSVTVKSRIDGQLFEINFKEGQDVAQGDVLAKIDPRVYQAEYDQAVATRDKDAAQLAAAKIDLSRYESLGNRVTGQTVDTQRATVKQLEATVKADQAAIDNAKTMLGYAIITAPISGRTGLRQVDVGNIVHASDTTGLVVLTQVQPIAVTFTLPQQNLRAIVDEMAKGETLTALVVEANGKTVIDEGKLALYDNQIDQTTGTIKLKAVFPNEQRHLWPGGFVNVRLRLTVRKDGLVVPAPAVQRGPNGTFVYVVNAERKVEMKNIKVAVVENARALIDDGLAGDETVVVDGMARLQPGAEVTLSEANADKAKAGRAEGERKPRNAEGQDKAR